MRQTAPFGVRRGKGWHGESRRHSDAATKQWAVPSVVGKFGSGGREMYDLLMQQADMNDAMRFNSILRIEKDKGSLLRGADVEKIWWLQIKKRTPSEYSKWVRSMD